MHKVSIIISSLCLCLFTACQSAVPEGFPTPIDLDALEAASWQLVSPDGRLCYDEPEFRSHPADHLERTWEENNTNLPSPSGFGSMLMRISDSVLVGPYTYESPEGVAQIATYAYYYPVTELNNRPMTVRFMLFLNEQQIPVAIDGTSQLYYDYVMTPGDDGRVNFAIPPLQAGMHELTILLLLDLENPGYDLYNVQTFSIRSTLLVGGARSISPRLYEHIKPTKRAFFHTQDGWGLVMSLNPEEAYVFFSYTPLTMGESLDFYIYAGYEIRINGEFPDYPQPNEMPSAILMLVDYAQVPISPQALVLYYKFAENNIYSLVPVHLLPPQTPGKHDIILVRLNYPGFPLCYLHSMDPNDPRMYPTIVDVTRGGVEITP